MNTIDTGSYTTFWGTKFCKVLWDWHWAEYNFPIRDLSKIHIKGGSSQLSQQSTAVQDAANFGTFYSFLLKLSFRRSPIQWRCFRRY